MMGIMIKGAAFYLFTLAFLMSLQVAATPRRQRVDFSATTWQEPLRLTSNTGSIDNSVANYKVMLISYERLWHSTWGGFGIGGLAGAGSASGGGTSQNVVYAQGMLPYTIIGVQPRVFYALSDRVAIGASSSFVYRNISWPTDPKIDIDPAKTTNVIFAIDIDLNLSEHFGFRQSWGAWSADSGAFWRWGVTYDFD